MISTSSKPSPGETVTFESQGERQFRDNRLKVEIESQVCEAPVKNLRGLPVRLQSNAGADQAPGKTSD